ncbi:unnamed protein product [Lymnaea stagnalis]|uniref:MRH domain-containing protein n=1 Tax=Lymnaea stagnalis TaxID=6523 RepID=A0AAV2HPI6_LYMST
MNRFIAVATVLFLWTNSVCVLAVEVCTKTGPCSCTYSDKHIDFSSLASTTSEPKWKDTYDQFYNNRFSYNPCKPFTEGTCVNVAVCQLNNAGQYFECGSQESANFLLDQTSGLPAVEYSKTDGTGLTRYSRVLLNCITTEGDAIEIQGEGQTGHYGFKLNSKKCCAIAGGVTIEVSISVGSVLVIVFFVLLIVYLIAGIIFQKFVRKAEGKEILPNFSFWSGFPSLVRDGVFFIIRRSPGGKAGYSNI